MTTPIDHLDVVVIGGGLSGLAVAVGLHSQGKSVRIYEARGRLGGRIESVEVDGGHADLGPTWFWPGERNVESLVRSLGLPVHDQWVAGDAVILAGDQSQRARFDAPPSYRLTGGVAGLIDGLSSSLPAETVLLDTAVTRLERAAEGVVVHHASDTGPTSTAAGAAVLALPPSLVMKQGIVAQEDLPSDTAKVASDVAVWMGGVSKAVAVYRQPFWRDLGLSGLVSSPGGPFNEIHDMSGLDGTPAMLFGFGQFTNGSSPTVDGFVDQLVRAFGSDAAAPESTLIRHWSWEEWTTPQGGMLSQRFDLFGAPELQRASWDGRLYWSSTETGSVAPGHLEGALDAAARTVRALTAS